MRPKLSILSLSIAAGTLSSLPGQVRGDDAGGKVTENLYEISKPHMKDPFNWISIWRVSPQSQDPGGMHSWQASHPDGGSAQPNAAEAPAKARNDWKASEESRTRTYLKKVGPLMPSSIQAMPPMDASPKAAGTGPVKHYLSQAIVLTTPFLADPLGGTIFPQECKLRYSSSNESEILQLFDEVNLSMGAESGVKAGDLYRTYQVGNSYRSYAAGRNLGRLVETNGIVEVVRVNPKTSVARLVKCFGTISRDSRACPLTSPPEIEATSYSAATDNKLAAQVVWVTEQQQFPQPYSYAIVDRGNAKGYRAGDMVLFFNRAEGHITDKVLGNGIVVSVQERSATILIRDLFPGIINRGDYSVVIQSAVM
jgi:hypothetical protein